MTTWLRRAFIGLLLLLLGFGPAHAQDAPADTVAGWVNELTGQLSASQAGFRNWREGGVNTLALSTGLNGKARHAAGAWEQTHELRLAFGLVKQDTLDFRKAEDLIRLGSTLFYQGEGFFETFRPTAAAALRTQFTEGYNYDEDPLEEGRTPPVKVSDFFAPATLTQSLGLTYQPAAWITQRVGLGAKETIVAIERLRPLYGLDPDQTARLEAGLEALTEVDRDLFENVRYQSRLSLFAAFNQADLPDVLWENLITMQVNRWLNVNLEFVTLYDNDISSEMQIKEVLSLGVSFSLL